MENSDLKISKNSQKMNELLNNIENQDNLMLEMKDKILATEQINTLYSSLKEHLQIFINSMNAEEDLLNQINNNYNSMLDAVNILKENGDKTNVSVFNLSSKIQDLAENVGIVEGNLSAIPEVRIQNLENQVVKMFNAIYSFGR